MRAPRSIAAVSVAACVLLAPACGGDAEPGDPVDTVPSPGASGSPAQTATTTVTTAAHQIRVSIAAGNVDPAPGRFSVREGDTVRIVVTSDVADELHVHGYERTVKLAPGKPTTLEFVADRQGLFDVETHETTLTLFQLQVS